MNRLYSKIIVFFTTTSLFSLVHAEVLFERGSTWKYLKGSRSSLDWLTTDFDNLDWPNGGEKLALENAKGKEVLKFKYNNKFPWPIAGYVKGRSLQVVDPFSDSNNSANWIVSPQIGGSPGK